MSVTVIVVTAVISLFVAWVAASTYQLIRPCTDSLCFAGLDQALAALILSVCIGLGTIASVYRRAKLRRIFVGALLFALPIVIAGFVILFAGQQITDTFVVLVILAFGSIISCLVGTFLPSAKFMWSAKLPSTASKT